MDSITPIQVIDFRPNLYSFSLIKVEGFDIDLAKDIFTHPDASSFPGTLGRLADSLVRVLWDIW